MEFKDFITRQAARVGKKQAQIVSDTGASKGTVSLWFSQGNHPSPKFYSKLCRSLLVDLDVLQAAINETLSESFFENDDFMGIGDSSGSYDTEPFVSVPMVESFYHGGNGDGLERQDEPKFLKSLSFRRDWLEYMDFDIAQLKVAMVHGKSMEPTLGEADVILIDKREADILKVENGAIYALVFKKRPMVKRVYVQETGNVKLVSDNKRGFDDINYSEEEAKEIEFIGRVVWRGGEVS